MTRQQSVLIRLTLDLKRRWGNKACTMPISGQILIEVFESAFVSKQNGANVLGFYMCTVHREFLK